jgi:transcriptional regulator with XRE-family HTH domain
VFTQSTSAPTERLALAIPEARLDHGLSQRQLAALSGVSRHMIRKLERGGNVDPALLVRLGAAFLVLDAYRAPYFDDGLHALLRAVQDKGLAA